MQKMKGVVVYDSKYGNTEIIAEELERVLAKAGHDVETCRVSEAPELDAGRYDFLLVGTPNHIGGPSRKTKKFVKKLPSDWSGKPFAVFETLLRVSESDPGEASVKLAKTLTSKGMSQLVGPARFVVEGMKGPLAPDAIPKAEEYAVVVVSALEK